MASPFSYVLCLCCGVFYVDVRFLLTRTSKLAEFVRIEGLLSAKRSLWPTLLKCIFMAVSY